MKKIGQYIILLKNVIVLAWLFVVLLVFKIICNFKFTNGLSIIFLIALISVPLAVYLFSFLNRKKYRLERLERTESYYKKIYSDFKNGRLEKEFINKVKGIPVALNLKIVDSQIILENKDLEIGFDEKHAWILLFDTKVIFNYYYLGAPELSKYDEQYFNHKDTLAIYIAMLKRLDAITKDTLTYTESVNDCILMESTSGNVLYKEVFTKIQVKENKLKNKRSVKKIINLVTK